MICDVHLLEFLINDAMLGFVNAASVETVSSGGPTVCLATWYRHTSTTFGSREHLRMQQIWFCIAMAIANPSRRSGVTI